MSKIRPMMSRNVAESFDNANPTIMRIDFQKTYCLEKDCALWIVEMGESSVPIERCGLIK